jgi:hypothetical protein
MLLLGRDPIDPLFYSGIVAVDTGAVRPDLVEIIDASNCPVDVLTQPESMAIEMSPRFVAIGATLVGLLVVLVAGLQHPAGEQLSLVVPTTIGTGELSRSAPSRRFQPDSTDPASNETIEGGQPNLWPDPPSDHDPSYVGRPGTNEPVRTYLVNKTLLYVNDSGRPTIVNLTTGDQQEVLVADSRISDTFELEFGRIVTNDPLNSDLPQHEGRSIVIMGLRTGSVEKTDALVMLCLDGSGCSPEALTAGSPSFDGDSVLRTTGSRDALERIAQVVRASEWSTEHRWTIFSLETDDPDDPEELFRIPTPPTDAIVWIIEQVP